MLPKQYQKKIDILFRAIVLLQQILKETVSTNVLFFRKSISIAGCKSNNLSCDFSDILEVK